jgi:hypothetical protein
MRFNGSVIPWFSNTFRPQQFNESFPKFATEIDSLKRMNQSDPKYGFNSATKAMVLCLRTTELLARWQQIVKAETIRVGIEFLFTPPLVPRHRSITSQWMELLPTTGLTPSKVCPNYGKGQFPDLGWILASAIIRGKEIQSQLEMGLRFYAHFISSLATEVFDQTSVLLQRLHNKGISGPEVLLLTSNLSTILFLSRNQYARTKLTESLLGADDLRILMSLLDKRPHGLPIEAPEAIQKIKDHRNADHTEIFQRLATYTELQLDALAKHHDVEWIVLRTLFRLNTLCRLEKIDSDRMSTEAGTELITQFQKAMSSAISATHGKQQKMNKLFSDLLDAVFRSGQRNATRCHCTQCLATINPEQLLAIALSCQTQLRDSATMSQSRRGIKSRASQAEKSDLDKRTSPYTATYPGGENGQLKTLLTEVQPHSPRDDIEYDRLLHRKTEDAKKAIELLKTKISLVFKEHKDNLRTHMHNTPSMIGVAKFLLMRKELGLAAAVETDTLRGLKDVNSLCALDLRCMRQDHAEILKTCSEILKSDFFLNIDEGGDLLETLRCDVFFAKAQVEYLLQVMGEIEGMLENVV